MFSNLLKNLSILKKFLFINLIFFTIIGLFTFVYLKNVQPNLIKKKSSNHIKIINNTIDNLNRLEIRFIEEDILKHTNNFITYKWQENKMITFSSDVIHRATPSKNTNKFKLSLNALGYV